MELQPLWELRRIWHWQLRRGQDPEPSAQESKPVREKSINGCLSTLGLGLEDRLTSKVGLLSGGQRQALTLLMATLKKPKLLLLDEHTAALDPKTAAKGTGNHRDDCQP